MTQTPLRAGRIIDETHAEENVPELQQGKALEIDAQLLLDESDEQEEKLAQLSEELTVEKSSLLKRLFYLALIGLIGTELVFTIVASFSQSYLLGGLYCLVISLAFMLIGKVLIKEYRLLKRLKKNQINRQQAFRLLNSEQVGEAKGWLEQVNKFNQHPDFEKFTAQITEYHSDKEVMQLYQDTILVKQDKQASDLINRFALESGTMVAVSPIAIVDMAVVLWRGTKMIEQLSALYGMPLGYASRIKLYRTLLKQMLFAGSTELISDFTATALSAELAGKLSARAAQGISVGIFTARIGFKTMEIARPIPQLPKKKSLLVSSTRYLLQKLVKREE